MPQRPLRVTLRGENRAGTLRGKNGGGDVACTLLRIFNSPDLQLAIIINIPSLIIKCAHWV